MGNLYIDYLHLFILMNKEVFLAYDNAEERVAKGLLHDEDPDIIYAFEKVVSTTEEPDRQTFIIELMANCMLELLRRDLIYSNSVSIGHIKRITEKGLDMIERNNSVHDDSTESRLITKMSENTKLINELIEKDSLAKDDTIEEAILDLCNYSAILWARLVSE